MKFELGFTNGVSTSSSPSKFVQATLSSSLIPYESSKAQDSKTKSFKNPNAKPQKARHQRDQLKKAKSHHAFMYHNKRHIHMHFRPQKFMHYCDCEVHTHSRLIVSRKAINHHNYAKLAYVGGQNRSTKIKCFYWMKFENTNNVYYYRQLHLNILPIDYFKSHKPRPIKVWVQKVVWWFLLLLCKLLIN